MTVKQLSKIAINYLLEVIYRPTLYVALVVGGLIGGGAGALTGFFSGIFFGQEFKICAICPSTYYGYTIPFVDMNTLAGAVVGIIIGAAAGAGITALATGFQTFRNKALPLQLGNKTMLPVLKFCLLIAIELSLGMLVGGIIGASIYLSFGSFAGACMGFLIMFLLTIIQTNQQK